MNEMNEKLHGLAQRQNSYGTKTEERPQESYAFRFMNKQRQRCVFV